MHCRQTRWWIAWAALCVVGATGCWRHNNAVVVYTALDQEFSAPMFDQFHRETGIVVRPKFDTEATKTVGLAQAIFAEADRPRCDVFWNNEILNTLRLARQGLLEPFRPSRADEVPAAFRSPQELWYGFAARARVLVVNTRRLPPEERPRSILALRQPRWRGQCGLAKPLMGTTATHAACLFAHWGAADAEAFFEAVRANKVQILAGNKHVAQQVAAGTLAWGVTDTDDAMMEIEAGQPVAIVYPDQEDGGLGTLFIPNTLAIVKGCPHPESARQLADWLLSPQVEAALAAGPSAQIPLLTSSRAAPRVKRPGEVRAMVVDWARAADAWDTAAAVMRELFAAD